MDNFSHTIFLRQAQLDELKARLADAEQEATKPNAVPGFTPVGRASYERSKYRLVPASQVDRVEQREVF